MANLTQGTSRALLRGGAAGYAGKVQATGPIAYWMQGETAGAVAYCQISSLQNGTHTAVTLAQPGIGDGRTSPLYDGATSYTNVYSATLAGAFNGAEGTVMCWAKVSGAGVWTDGNTGYMFSLETASGGDNTLYIRKDTVNNTIRWRYSANNVDYIYGKAGVTSVDWMHLALTWTASVPQAYYNGVASGAAGATDTWAGAPTGAVVGSQNLVPALVFSGTLAHCAIWDRALTPAEVAALAVV